MWLNCNVLSKPHTVCGHTIMPIMLYSYVYTARNHNKPICYMEYYFYTQFQLPRRLSYCFLWILLFLFSSRRSRRQTKTTYWNVFLIKDTHSRISPRHHHSNNLSRHQMLNLTFNPFFNVFKMKTTTLIDTSQRLHVCNKTYFYAELVCEKCQLH